ncbi:NAD(P)/FAD-dependent oxidoreductase [Actinocrispum wychmicini]|nr:FAD-dependent oxidoreductase [Actinocrispum wychmicini]
MGVVGAGVAGAVLAWRVRQLSPQIRVDVYGGRPGAPDASGVSGGLVRGFESTRAATRLAVDSLTELRDDPVLLAAAGYQETGSVYLLSPGCDPTASLQVINESLPGSATVFPVDELRRRYPFRGLAADTIAVVERHAGHLSPERLRTVLLAESGAVVRAELVQRVDPAPSVRLAGGETVGYDVVVVAAGAWTPGLLAASGLPAEGLTTKQIQYSVHPARLPGLGSFVDDVTGLYGRPVDDGFLLGLPCDRWDVDPADVHPDADLVRQVTDQAGRRLDGWLAPPVRTVAATDCYHVTPGLRLRETVGGEALFTFTGGSGGAAKSVLAATRIAATDLLCDRFPLHSGESEGARVGSGHGPAAH